VEAADDYVKIITDDGTFLKKRTMSFFENSLSAYHFVRVHRSYIVNSQLITRIDPLEKDSHILLLTTGAKIPISKPGYSRLKEVLGI
jgi:two-component system LytT family response regulator